MADRKATIKLSLKTDGFKRGLKEVEQASDEAAKKTGSAFKGAMQEGAKGGLDAVNGLFSSIKSAAGGVAGLIGGIGFGALIKGSIDSQKSFKQLAFNISQGTGQAVKWQDLQRKVQKVAGDAKVDVDKLGMAYRAAFAETGSAEFANETLDAIAKTSKATGADMEVLGKLAGTLGQKFGLSSDQIGDGLTQMVISANQGGASIEDLSEDFGEIGGKAKSLGLQGPEGIRKMVGFLNLAKKETGSFQQGMAALPIIFDQIIERTSKGVVKSGGKVPITIQAVDKDGNPRDPFEIISEIIKKTKGDAGALGEFGFGGEGLQTILGIAKGFRTELKATGGDVDKASRVLDNMLSQSAGAVGDFSDVVKEAAEDTPADKLQDATNKLKEAFTKPEMIAAIEKLATALPKLAAVIGKVVGLVAESPVLAGAVFTGATAAKGAAGGAAGSILSSVLSLKGGKGAAGAMKAGITTGGSAAGADMASQIGTAGLAVGIAWGAAFEQASKLGEELSQHQKDVQDERANLLGVAEKRGDTAAFRKRSLAEQVFSGDFSDEEKIFRDPKTGAIQSRATNASDREFREKGAVSIDFQDLQHAGSEQSDRIDQQVAAERAAASSVGGGDPLFSNVVAQAEAKFGRKLTGKEEGKLGDIRSGFGQGSSGLSGAGGQASVDIAIAQLSKGVRASSKPVVAALKGELRVRVTNARDIGGNSGPSAGSTPKVQ